MGLQAKFLGAVGQVTGSCHMLHDTRTDRYYLVDCGSYQGISSDNLNASRFIDGAIGGIKCSEISAVFLTHAHLDHCGMLPLLVRFGFKGKIFCTDFTRRATLVSLRDAVKHNNDLYESSHIDEMEKLMFSVDRDKYYVPGHLRNVIQADGSFGFSFTRTSHLMGCVAVEFVYNDLPEGSSTKDDERIRIVFGADTGPVLDAEKQGTLVKAIQTPSPLAQTIVLESTYGNRRREPKSFNQRITELANILEAACVGKDSPIIVIPTFSIQRTQEVLMDIASVLNFKKESTPSLFRDQDPPTVTCISGMASEIGQIMVDEFKARNSKGKPSFANLDHPLFSKFEDDEQIYRFLAHIWSGNPNPEFSDYFKFSFGKFTKTPKQVNIVVGSSGMCSGGSIMNILKDTLTSKDTTVILTGYQAQGTPGSILSVLSEGKVPRKNERFNHEFKITPDQVKAKIVTVGFYSGHADCDGLISYALRKDMPNKVYSPVSIVLVHGEADSRDALREELQQWNKLNPELTRGLNEIFMPSSQSGWYDCKTRKFVKESTARADEKLASLQLTHAQLQSIIDRFLDGEFDATKLKELCQTYGQIETKSVSP